MSKNFLKQDQYLYQKIKYDTLKKSPCHKYSIGICHPQSIHKHPVPSHRNRRVPGVSIGRDFPIFHLEKLDISFLLNRLGKIVPLYIINA